MSPSALSGKRVLVTGASGGLGKALSAAFARAGTRLLLTGRRAEVLAGLVEDLRGGVGEASAPQFVTVDLADANAALRIHEEARRFMGGVDILVNCAGVFPVSPIGAIDPEAISACLAINVGAPIRLAREFVPGMVDRGWGRVVNIGSSSAYSGFKNTTLYCASKHALLGFSRALHDEVKDRNVRVLCVSPGSIQTPMGRLVVGQDFETFLDPEEIAQFVVDLTAIDGPMSVDEVRLNRMAIR